MSYLCFYSLKSTLMRHSFDCASVHSFFLKKEITLTTPCFFASFLLALLQQVLSV